MFKEMPRRHRFLLEAYRWATGRVARIVEAEHNGTVILEEVATDRQKPRGRGRIAWGWRWGRRGMDDRIEATTTK